MKITMNDIFHSLTAFNAEKRIWNNPKKDIYSVRTFNRSTSFSSSTIYLGYSKDIPVDSDFKNQSVNLICFGNKTLQMAKFRGKSRLNIIQIHSNDAFSSVLNQLMDIWEHPEESASSPHLMESVFYGKGIQYILDVGYEILSNPIFFMTFSGVLIAKSSKTYIDDPLCIELIKSGLFSDKTMQYISQNGFSQAINSVSTPIPFQRDSLKYNRIIQRVSTENSLEGVLVVMEVNRKISQSDVSALTDLADIIKNALTRITVYNDISYIMMETLITDLVDGIITENADIRNRFAAIGRKMPRSFRLCTVNFIQTSNTYLSFYREMLMQCLNTHDVYIYRDSVVILLENENADSLDLNADHSFFTILKDANLICGVSKKMQRIADFQIAYQQTLKCFSYRYQSRHTSSPITYYEDISLFVMLDSLEASSFKWDITNSAATDLLAYDIVHNSEYSQTLLTYLKNGMEAGLTAEELHIHKNTMTYRLKRISELVNIDWTNGYQLVQIYLSLSMTIGKG